MGEEELTVDRRQTFPHCSDHRELSGDVQKLIIKLEKLISTIKGASIILGLLGTIASIVLAFYLNRAAVLTDKIVDIERTIAVHDKQIEINTGTISGIQASRLETAAEIGKLQEQMEHPRR